MRPGDGDNGGPKILYEAINPIMLYDGTEAYLNLQCAAQIALVAETREAPQKWLPSLARFSEIM